MTEVETRDLVAEAYAAYFMLHCMGFPDARLRVAVVKVLNAIPGPGEAVVVQVLTRRKPVFSITISRTDADIEKFDRDWAAFLQKREKMSDRELNTLVESTEIRRRQVELLLALANRGLLGSDGRAKPELYVVGQA